MNLKIDKMTLNDLETIKEILENDFDDFWNYNILKQELENNSQKASYTPLVYNQKNLANIETKFTSRNKFIHIT